MSKERSSEIFAAKMNIFPEKNLILVREKCFRPPQTRRQVSATGLKYALCSILRCHADNEALVRRS